MERGGVEGLWHLVVGLCLGGVGVEPAHCEDWKRRAVAVWLGMWLVVCSDAIVGVVERAEKVKEGLRGLDVGSARWGPFGGVLASTPQRYVSGAPATGEPPDCKRPS